MRCFNEKITERMSRYIPTCCAALILGFAAHMFMLANKICFAGDAGGLFRKGDTIVSGRWGLALTSYIMPDISMPWLNGLMSLLLIGVAVCMTVSIFKIRSRALQILLAGLIVCSPAQTATFCFVGSAVPFASEEEIEEIKKNAEYDEMSVYPYYGSVKRINDCVVVKLGE